jgi:hypothetical protein
MDLTANVHQFYANLEISALETMAMIRQTFEKESMSRTRLSPNSPKPKSETDGRSNPRI